MRHLPRRLGVTITAVAASLALAGAGTAYAGPGTGPAPATTSAKPGATQAAGVSRATSPDKATSTTASYVPAPCAAAPKNGADGPYARCFAEVRASSAHRVTPDADAPPPGSLGPADIQAAYHLPADAPGGTIAIVDAYGDSHAEADLAVFRSHYGLPACTTANGCLRIVDQNGGSHLPGDDQAWAIETSLDLDAASSACPNCHLLLVQGYSPTADDLGIAVDTAVAMGAKFVSNSYGLVDEMPGEAVYDHYYNHPGVAVTVSTGDIAAVPSFPATDPHVVSVGGTTLTRDSSAPRGWTEKAWYGGGSGCSAYLPKPSYQQSVSTGCSIGRATADVSADADPATGLAVYDTVSELGVGWFQVGGTSLAAPLIAGMYALAGAPPAKDYPVADLYDQVNSGHFNDVTTGANGTCGTLQCQAGPGWDAPTGLGTPNGTAGLRTAPHGDIVGRVTSGGRPLAGVLVATSDGYTARTDATGHYDLWVRAASYNLTASMFGYTSANHKGVKVKAGARVSVNFSLKQLASQTISGVVTDGSGHGWPLYAKITVAGMSGAVYTDPYTGRYTLTVPRNASYTLHVASAVLPGYRDVDVPVQVADRDVQRDATLGVNPLTCLTPGYAAGHRGTVEQFTGWSTTTQDGWTTTDNNDSGTTWTFDNPYQEAPPPGGDKDFAYADSLESSPDTDLVSPVVDLTGQNAPEIGFDTEYKTHPDFPNALSGEVDLSLDGGTTWTPVWHKVSDTFDGRVDLPIPQAANQKAVRVRFHFTATAHQGFWWMLDNVVIGTRTCTPTTGGLVAGTISDANTHAGLDDATVVGAGRATDTASSLAMPDDPNAGHGFYVLVSSLTGDQRFTVADGRYTAADATVPVAADSVTRKDWALGAGRLTVDDTSVSLTQPLGGTSTGTVTLHDTGTAPVHVSLGTQGGALTPQVAVTGTGAPLQHVRGQYLPWRSVTATPTAAVSPQATPQSGPWTPLADYPMAVFNNAVAYDDATGKVYSVAGLVKDAGEIANGYVYDPAGRTWRPIADLPRATEAPTAVSLNGTLYVIGGWDVRSGELLSAFGSVYAYDPATNTWSHRADLPEQVGGARAVALGGRVYVIGGSSDGVSGSSAVFRYDPTRNTWTQVADYPVPVAANGCAAINGQVVCAGGFSSNGNPTRTTYRYDPGTDSWSRGADMPYDDWGMTYSGAGGKLQVAGGITDANSDATNQAAQYDPVGDTWSALPNANDVSYNTGGGSGCGLYQIGSAVYDGFQVEPSGTSETLPGYDQCGDGFHLPWLSVSSGSLDLKPGQSATVSLTVDSSSITQPGTLTAALGIGTDTPYPVAPVTVTTTVTPPANWGELAGTVTDAATGKAIAGATVQICAGYDAQTGDCGTSYTLRTDTDGHYQLWLEQSEIQLIVAKDDYQQQVRMVSVRRGHTATVDVALQRDA